MEPNSQSRGSNAVFFLVKLDREINSLNPVVFSQNWKIVFCVTPPLPTHTHTHTHTISTPKCFFVSVGRIDRAAIRKALSQFPRDTALPVRAYICGPGSMIDDVESCLAAEGVPEQQIHYEKWW